MKKRRIIDINIGDKFRNTQNGVIGTIINRDDTMLEDPLLTIEYNVKGIFRNETLTYITFSKVFLWSIKEGVLIKI
ncbi:hypothetical protein [uncultured Clostridium sp.]|uniref:hypothetical protein n=1 Tax=uncultured Clostridium sp. TaxID=59620 RepID=UPI0027DC2DDF|nr:hypothetical protein [uncultured Clostridium sp.]